MKEEEKKHSASKVFSKSIIYVLRFLYFLLALGIIISVGYFFGYTILWDPFSGNDGGFSWSQAVWIDRYFPQIPFWYPLQGAGISIVGGYPILFIYVSSLLNHISPLNLVESMAILQFLSLVIPSVGIYLLVWSRFKHQTVALVAAILYYLSSMTYVWIIGAGFFAQTFSFIFVPFAFLFFDWYLEMAVQAVNGIKRRLAFLGTVLTLVLATMGHPATGIGLMIIFIMYSFIAPLLIYKGSKWVNLRRALVAMFLTHSTSVLLMLFWLYPLQRYIGMTGRGMHMPPTADLSTMAVFTMRSTLGLPVDINFPYTNFSITPVVWMLAILTGLFSFFYSRKAFTFFLIGLWALFLTGSIHFYAFVYPALLGNAQFFNMRYYTGITIMLLPILAALGPYYLSKTIFLPLSLIVKKTVKHNFTRTFLLSLVHVAVLGVFLFIVAIAVVQLRNIYNSDKNVHYYGPQVGGGYNKIQGHSFSNIWDYSQCTNQMMDSEEFMKKSYSCPFPRNASFSEQMKHVPPFKIAKQEDGAASSIIGENGILKAIPQDSSLRIDISPNLGAQTKIWSGYSDVPVINTYNFQSSLIHPMWGYEQGVFYSKDGLFEKPVLVNELGKYFGLDYIVLNPSIDPMDKFVSAGWVKYSKEEAANPLAQNNKKLFEVWRPEVPTGLSSIISQPKVLHIGTLDLGAYEQTFRDANLGMLPYDLGYLIEGESHFIDDYSLADLKGFDAVVLHGYSYHSKNAAWNRLDQYVKEGGSLFVDNGWQYIDKDWGTGPDKHGKFFAAQLPEPFPVTSSQWSDVGPTWDSFSLNPEVSGDTDLATIGSPSHAGKNWGGSYANNKDLRTGAVPVLSSSDGKVVIAAKNHGQGKVIWSGMNFMAFTGTKRDDGTLQLGRNLFTWLLPAKSVDEKVNDSKVKMDRPSPDKVVFTFQENVDPQGFVFRESYYPGWQAVLAKADRTSEKLTIYRGGPGFMYVNMPAAQVGETLTFEYKKPLLENIAVIVSIITGILLVLYLFGLLKLSKMNVSFLGALVPSKYKEKIQKHSPVKKVKKNIDNLLKEEEDY